MNSKKLTEICSPKQWKTISQAEMLSEGYPVYGANGIIGYYNEYNHEYPTVLITCRGATCGTLNICKPFSYVNGNAMALDNVIYDIDEKYLYYYLQSRGLKDIISGSAQPQITIQNLSKVVVNYPNIEEQKKIVNTLDKADEIRQKKKLANDKLDEFLKSTFIKMFENKNYNKVRIGIVTENTVQINPSQIFDNMFYYVDISSINNEKCIITTPKYMNVSEAPSRARKRINKNDILVSTVRPYLRGFAIVPTSLDNQIASTGFSVLRAKPELINPLFLFSYVKSENFISQILPKMEGASYPAVRDDDIRDVILELPPIDLQNQFAQIVEKVEVQKQKNELVIEQMNNLFNSLSQRAFKGKYNE